MTSRLKHKLEIENINTKSKYLNESFVQVRYPFPRGLAVTFVLIWPDWNPFASFGREQEGQARICTRVEPRGEHDAFSVAMDQL